MGSDWTEYIYFGGQVIAERDQASTWTDYVFAGGRRLAKAPATAATSETEYYHGDHLGSSRMITNASGVPTWEATYLPFGQEHNPQPTVNHYKFTGQERDSESNLDYFGARYYGSTMGRFSSADPIFMNVIRVMDPQRLNLYTYARNNPLLYTDPTGKDIVGGTGDQKAVRAALVEIARHPGGREFLTKLDNLSVKIAISTATDLKGSDGRRAYGVSAAAPGDNTIKRVTDASGTITDVTNPNIETAVDFDFAKADQEAGKDGAPQSDAELLGHELKHTEATFFKLPNTEESATQGIDDILKNEPTKESKKGAEQFVDNLLKPKSQSNQQPQSPPSPTCTAEKDKPCPK